MKRSISRLILLAAAVVLFGASASLQAETVDRATIPTGFHIGGATLTPGTYDLKLSADPMRPILITNKDKGTSVFAMSSSVMEHNNRTRERGPVLIMKCAYRGCFVTEIWTANEGHLVSHPRSLDEDVASSTRVVALTRVTLR